FLANRSNHALTHANMDANMRVEFVPQGVVSRMYPSLPGIYMQMSKPCDFIPVPDWYYGIEYAKEQERGYDYKEDLFVPGYFEFPIEKGETVYFSASLSLQDPEQFSGKYSAILSQRPPRDNF